MNDEFCFDSEPLQARLKELYALFEVEHEVTENGALVVRDPAAEILIDALQSVVRTWRLGIWWTKCLRDEVDDDGAYLQRALDWLQQSGVEYELEHHDGATWAVLREDPAVEQRLDELDV